MGCEVLKKEIQQEQPFASLAEEALLNILRTANQLDQLHGQFFKPYELTATQYNVLRILRGAHPAALACSEVGERMVTAVPDVTRLLDRLEGKGLIARIRDRTDRRVVKVSITPSGLALLAEIDLPLDAWIQATLDHVADEQLSALIGLLERARGGLNHTAAHLPPGDSGHVVPVSPTRRPATASRQRHS